MNEQQLLHAVPMLPVSLLRHALQENGGLMGDQPVTVRVVAPAGVQGVQLESEQKPLGVRLVAVCACGRRALRLRLDQESGWWRCSRCMHLRSARTMRGRGKLFRQVVVPALDLARERKRMNGMRTTRAQRSAFAQREEEVVAKMTASLRKVLQLEKYEALLARQKPDRVQSRRAAPGPLPPLASTAEDEGQTEAAAVETPSPARARGLSLKQVIGSCVTTPEQAAVLVTAEEQRLVDLFVGWFEASGLSSNGSWSAPVDGPAFKAALGALEQLMTMVFRPPPRDEAPLLQSVRKHFVPRLMNRLWESDEGAQPQAVGAKAQREAGGDPVDDGVGDSP
jgi:hypothetical protein